MKYTQQFKIECAEKYERGERIDVPPGPKRQSFMGQVIRWARLYRELGPESLAPIEEKRAWTPEMIRGILAQVHEGRPVLEIADEAHINTSLIRRWMALYDRDGSPCDLQSSREMEEGSPGMADTDAKREIPGDDIESLARENEALRKRIRELEMELAFSKKLRALAKRKSAARAKAKDPER